MRTPNRVPPWRALLLVFVTNTLDYTKFQLLQNVAAEDIITYGNQFTYNQENNHSGKKTREEAYDKTEVAPNNDKDFHDRNIRKRKKPQYFGNVYYLFL